MTTLAEQWAQKLAVSSKTELSKLLGELREIVESPSTKKEDKTILQLLYSTYTTETIKKKEEEPETKIPTPSPQIIPVTKASIVNKSKYRALLHLFEALPPKNPSVVTMYAILRELEDLLPKLKNEEKKETSVGFMIETLRVRIKKQVPETVFDAKLIKI